MDKCQEIGKRGRNGMVLRVSIWMWHAMIGGVVIDIPSHSHYQRLGAVCFKRNISQDPLNLQILWKGCCNNAKKVLGFCG